MQEEWINAPSPVALAALPSVPRPAAPLQNASAGFPVVKSTLVVMNRAGVAPGPCRCARNMSTGYVSPFCSPICMKQE